MADFLEECGVEEAKKARLGNCINDLLLKQAEAVVKRAEQSWDARVEAMLKHMDHKIDAKIDSSEKKTMALISQLQKEINDIKMNSGAPSNASTHMQSIKTSRTSNLNTYSFQNQGQDFVPQFVEIKGFISDWNRMDKEALTKPEAMQLLTDILANMDPAVRGEIDVEKTEEKMRGVFVAKIETYVSGGSQACWRVKKELEKAIREKNIKANNISPWCVVQPAPWKKPCLQAAGKFLGYLKKQGVNKEAVKVDSWGPPRVRIAHVPQNGRPALLAEFTEKNGWSVQEGELNKLDPNLTAADVLSAMRE